MIGLHANDDSELAGNLNNILGWRFWLWHLIQELDKDEEMGKKSIRI